jgi:hypothetical protein
MMPEYVIENLRLKELILVVNLNKPFFDEFVLFLKEQSYEDIIQFICEKDEKKLKDVLQKYFEYNFTHFLFDGIARPYESDKSKWFFITWLLRDAPTQRLQPLVSSQQGATTQEKRIVIIIKLIKFISPLFPNKEQWNWFTIAEVMLQRLEGSRRSLKGGLFEAIVRTLLIELFESQNINLEVKSHEVRLNDETYDIQINGKKGTILMPVKTRETMGGGHASLFTRDIHKSIIVANENGYNCIPIVIAESWAGKLDELSCKNYIYISENPNQLDKINPLLKVQLQTLIGVFAEIQ